MKLISHLLGTVVVLEGLHEFITDESKIGLYIALAIIVVGPLEDLLNNISGSAEWRELVNQLTSIAFLVFLGLILKESTS